MMHDDHDDTPAETLREIVLARRPALADAQWQLHERGFDSRALSIGTQLFKFPRHAAGAASLRREAAILQVIAPHLQMRVPDMVLHEEPRLHSEHRRIPGGMLTPQVYAGLPESDRQRLAEQLAGFYRDLHGIDAAPLRAAGAGPVGDWNPTKQIEAQALPLLPAALRDRAGRLLRRQAALGPDPLGQTFGFFDGHGWNMAFADDRLNGIYDFADSGFGPLHREFIYSDFISRDLTRRIVAAYEQLRGLALDRARLEAHMATLLLDELAGTLEEPERRGETLEIVLRWFAEG